MNSATTSAATASQDTSRAERSPRNTPSISSAIAAQTRNSSGSAGVMSGKVWTGMDGSGLACCGDGGRGRSLRGGVLREGGCGGGLLGVLDSLDEVRDRRLH